MKSASSNNNKCYISGKITGLEPQIAEDNFLKAVIKAEKLGYECVNPISNLQLSWFEFMLRDIQLLFDCSTIYVQANFISSKGAVIEVFIAVILKKKIIFQSKTQKIMVLTIVGIIQLVIGVVYGFLYTADFISRSVKKLNAGDILMILLLIALVFGGLTVLIFA